MRRYVLAAIAILWAGPGIAYDVPDHTLREKVDASDVVTIADVMNKPRVMKSDSDQYIWVKPQIVLKGKPAHEIKVQVDNGVPEASVDCCSPGTKVLLFLSELPRGTNEYAIVWAHRGGIVIIR